jgi:hypothetical protein
MDKCEKCGWQLSFSGVVNCLCDKDNCFGNAVALMSYIVVINVATQIVIMKELLVRP